MELVPRVVLLITLWGSIVDVNAEDTCKTPQYAELGSRATIHCYFTESFYGVYWYDSTNTLTDEPILLLQSSAKTGKGYDSGEFDIYLNGSLIINHVTQSHDQDFAVVKLRSSSDDPTTFIVHVVVIVRPLVPFPRIDRCMNRSRVCVTQLHPTTQLTCVVQDVRPAVELQWLRRTYRSDVNISQMTSTVSHDEFLYNTTIFTTETLRNSSILELLVCRAVKFPPVLEKQESFILVQNKDVDLFSAHPISIFVQRYSKMELNCTEVPAGFLIWKKFKENMKSVEDIFMAVFLRENFVKGNSENFELGHRGSLVSPNIDFKNEGKYACVFGNGFIDGVTLYDVTVYVEPPSVHPVIVGCKTDWYCELSVQTTGNLSCKVEGIRPEVHLQWKAPYVDSEVLTFSNQQTKVKSNGETFTVSTTTDYSVHSEFESNRLAIECTITGKYGYLFGSSAKADLFFLTKTEVSPTDSKSEVTTNQSLVWIIVTTITVVIIVLLLTVSTYYIKVKRRTNKKPLKIEREEHTPMFMDTFLDQELKDKKDLLVNSLKGKYEDLYDAIQPIPYIRDRLYCVNKVYVEGGLDILLNDKGNETKRTWERIETYHSILSDSRIKSTRKVVEGDAGYGKTTLTLQFSYDWCNRVDKSPLVDVEILILLRLRQLSGVTSVYRAIRQFLLPRDSTLNEEDIETLLQTLPSDSILVILDGFDEYSDQDLMQDTDIMHIIRKDMFQQIPVILTTRSSCIPHDLAANTRHIRLTGFDELARDRYIRKAVVGTDVKAAMKIKQRLKENPVLAGVCQVPLFFVMFAHMTHERHEFTQFQSVTSFFRFMIGCFHGHLHKKDKTKIRNFKSFEKDHGLLDQEALNSLSGGSKQNVWRKETLSELLGDKFYEHYVRVGILVEEEVLDFAEENGSSSSYYQPYRKDVRFYHKLFCEWYAAHYLSNIAAKSLSPSLELILSRLDPFELHYLYRFACGLNQNAANNILQYLSGVESSEQFEILCILEQRGQVENIKNQVQKLCSDTIIVSDEDSQLQQKSTIELLEIASSNAILISCVSVENCIKSVDLETWNLNLKSGMRLSNLGSVQEISVTQMGRELTEQEVLDIIRFCFQCLELKVLRFDCCLLPQYIKVTHTESDINQTNIKVIWSCTESWLQLNLTSGYWEIQSEGKSTPITDDDYQSESAKFRREWSGPKARNDKE